MKPGLRLLAAGSGRLSPSWLLGQPRPSSLRWAVLGSSLLAQRPTMVSLSLSRSFASKKPAQAADEEALEEQIQEAHEDDLAADFHELSESDPDPDLDADPPTPQYELDRLRKQTEELLPEDWFVNPEDDMFDHMQKSAYYRAKKKHFQEKMPPEVFEEAFKDDFPLEYEFAPPPKEKVEEEPRDQLEIERFLKQFGEDEHADKFPNWMALMTYNSRKLKVLDVSMKSRKRIRKFVELFKQSMVLRGLSPAYPPWEKVSLEEARERLYEQDLARVQARVEARRAARVLKSQHLQAHLDRMERHANEPLEPYEDRARELREIARTHNLHVSVVPEEEFNKEKLRREAAAAETAAGGNAAVHDRFSGGRRDRRQA